MLESRSARAHLVLLVAGFLLAIVTLWAYLPILHNGFVWDDGANLIAVRPHWDNGLDGWIWAFTRPSSGHYQPLTWISYQVDALLSSASPRGVHTTNLILHGVATFLVGTLAWSLSGLPTVQPRGSKTPFPFRASASLLCAALFGLHPIHVETVAWATERRDLLSTVLTLSAVIWYVRTSTPESAAPRRLHAVTTLHALAALARAQMSLPFVLLALDAGVLDRLGQASDRRRSFLRLIAEKRAIFVVAAASAAAALWAQAAAGSLTSMSEHGLLDRLVQAGYSLAFYPAALIYRPYWLPLYERPFPFDPWSPAYLLPAVVGLAGLAGTAWACARRQPSLISLTILSYVLLVLPVSGLAQSGIQLVADRYAYLATIPLILLAGLAVAHILASIGHVWIRGFIWVMVTALVCGGASATRRQTAVWKDDETLWRHVLLHSGSSVADNNLGQILFARGESGRALFHLVRSLERVPVYPRPWTSLVAILEGPWPSDAPTPQWVASTIERAAARRPIEITPAYACALGWLRAGDRARSIGLLQAVVSKDPNHEGARRALARLTAPAAGTVVRP